MAVVNHYMLDKVKPYIEDQFAICDHVLAVPAVLRIDADTRDIYRGRQQVCREVLDLIESHTKHDAAIARIDAERRKA